MEDRWPRRVDCKVNGQEKLNVRSMARNGRMQDPIVGRVDIRSDDHEE